MIIVSYDFTCNKTRSQFSRYLKKYGRKIQYSVYQIKNSERVLKNLLNEIELNYRNKIKNTDSVLIFKLCGSCQEKIVRYGIDENLDNQVVFF